jgi:hypothetical protein
MKCRSVILILLVLTSTPAMAQEPAQAVTPRKGAATLRKCPEPKCPIIGSLPEGATALVFNQESGWYWLDVAKEHRSKGEFTTTAWVRMEDVRSVVQQVADATPVHKPATAVPTTASIAINEAAVEENCLACAATKEVSGEITLTAEGDTVGGPGAGEPNFDKNMTMAQSALGPQLSAAAKVAEAARADLNKYLSVCYGKYTHHDVHAGASAGMRTDSAAVVAAGNYAGSWAAVATASSSYAWRESWVDGVDVSNETTTYCRGLWSDVQQQASDVQSASADIKAQARGMEVWPLVIHRLLAQYGLK